LVFVEKIDYIQPDMLVGYELKIQLQIVKQLRSKAILVSFVTHDVNTTARIKVEIMCQLSSHTKNRQRSPKALSEINQTTIAYARVYKYGTETMGFMIGSQGKTNASDKYSLKSRTNKASLQKKAFRSTSPKTTPHHLQ